MRWRGLERGLRLLLATFLILLGVTLALPGLALAAFGWMAGGGNEGFDE